MRVRLVVLLALAAPGLAAQQTGGGALHTPDTTRVPLFPRTIGPGTAPAQTRFQVLAHRIDSLSAIGGEMQVAATERLETERASSRFLLLSQFARGLGRHEASRAVYGGDWVSAVTAAGVMQLGRSSLFAPGESGSGLLGSLRTEGAFAGLAGLTGGASWLLSNLTLYSPRFGVTHAHVTTSASHSH